MTLPPPPAPVTPNDGDQPPTAKPPSAGLVVLAVAMATLLAFVGLVWYLNEQESDDDSPSGQAPVGFVHAETRRDHGERPDPRGAR